MRYSDSFARLGRSTINGGPPPDVDCQLLSTGLFSDCPAPRLDGVELDGQDIFEITYLKGFGLLRRSMGQFR
ncbi:hypothetical protein [Mesorhizobium sp. M0571]